jgi:hypothetical protein
MTLNEYKALRKEEKYSNLRDKAVQLMIIQNAEFAFTLFQIDDFYVEVKYNRRRDKIEYLKVLEDLNLLQPYLLEIELSELENILTGDFN